MASFQLPAKYPQLPALLIGQIKTLVWHILLYRNVSVILPVECVHHVQVAPLLFYKIKSGSLLTVFMGHNNFIQISLYVDVMNRETSSKC